MYHWPAERVTRLPRYLFVEIDRKKRQAIDAGEDVIDFGVGDPDTSTPDFIVDELAKSIRDPANHRYPVGTGTPAFRRACAAFMERRFGLHVDYDSQITALIGSKEGIAHLPLAVVNPGQHVLVPEPAYPVYTAAALFAGGIPHVMPLSADRGWLPDLDAVPPDVADNAALMFLNYPNNPTTVLADLDFFQHAVRFARQHDILIAHDAAYCEVFFGARPPSILEVDGAGHCAIEFHSFSKTFNMTGWRVGFAAGNPQAVAALAKVKDNIDSGPFTAIQHAAAHALHHWDHINVRAITDLYRERRDMVVDALTTMGFRVDRPQATFYVWGKCPDGYRSMEFAARLLEKAAVVVVPGAGFGPAGDEHFRMALTIDTDRTRLAMERMKNVTW